MVVTRTGSYRPPMLGTTHAVSSGHHLASAAGMRILEAGGNAIDAGVAAGICLNVLFPEMCGFGGVAPIMVYLAGEDRTLTLSGVGPWPEKASVEYFKRNHGGQIPKGVERIVVPAAAGDWLTALEMWGTTSFAEVVRPALELATNGFPLPFTTAGAMPGLVKSISDWPSSMAIFAPNGKPLGMGELLVQRDLARTFERLVEAEKSRSGTSREAGISAAREEFYTGDIGEEMARFVQAEGGLLDIDDLGAFKIDVAEPLRAAFGDYEMAACGPWCQGPTLAETLQILRPDEVKSLKRNSPEYIHLVAEALKHAFADRDAFIGDPKFVDVPISGLMSMEFAASRRAAISDSRATLEMPKHGDPWKYEGRSAPGTWRYVRPEALAAAPGLDTSYACVIDRWGNAFSATPSDGVGGSPIVPGLGFTPSNRGIQSWVDERHPSSVAGGKRPRLTPNPAIAFRDGKMWMPFGTPGGDAQPQAMTQVFLNMAVYGMNVQAAIEAPRFLTWSFPDSAVPHAYKPGNLQLEGAIGRATGDHLKRMGHSVEWVQDYDANAGGVCAVQSDGDLIWAGADMRRESYAMGR
jgi:gamma-glutamyltranspeptidase/glutathione hydrolase